jgi:hypothetical protein
MSLSCSEDMEIGEDRLLSSSLSSSEITIGEGGDCGKLREGDKGVEGLGSGTTGGGRSTGGSRGGVLG